MTYRDEIIPWGAVREGDTVLHEESLKVVESIGPGPAGHRDVRFKDDDPASLADFVPAHALTARRCPEGSQP